VCVCVCIHTCIKRQEGTPVYNAESAGRLSVDAMQIEQGARGGSAFGEEPSARGGCKGVAADDADADASRQGAPVEVGWRRRGPRTTIAYYCVCVLMLLYV
jgi:hypothetical protein